MGTPWVDVRKAQRAENKGRLVVGTRVRIADYYCDELIAVHGESPAVRDLRGEIVHVMEIKENQFVFEIAWDVLATLKWSPFILSTDAWLKVIEVVGDES